MCADRNCRLCPRSRRHRAAKGDSPRSEFLTSATEAGAGLFAMMDVSRHKSVETVRDYIHRGDASKNHAANGLL